VSAIKYAQATVAPRIEAFLQNVLRKAGFRLKFDITSGANMHPDFENPDIVVKFSGPDVEYLLANRAELLLALEQLTMEMLRMPPEDHSRLCYDAHDYRALRIEELRLSAAAAADKVRRTGAAFRFSPMNSRERRIIHLALRDEPGVYSESSGVGSARQVVVHPRQAAPARR